MHYRIGFLALPLVVACVSGCSTGPRTSPVTTPERVPQPVAADRAPAPRPAEDFSDRLARCDASIAELEGQAAGRELQLVERGIRIRQLEGRLEAERVRLEEAIHEVVRARAKQRSVESRAEAASEIAEAEIALATLMNSVRRTDSVRPVAVLLAQAGAEFDAKNFGGALYLATQAKAGIRALRNRSDPVPDLQHVAGETPFEVPVPLEVKTRSNFRDGPGTEFPVLRKFDPGTTLTGYATKGAWVRARSRNGDAGWIHNSLVRGG